MLRIANSAALQRVTPVSSIAQALVVVGRRNLRRWVQLLLYADATRGSVANPLLQLAATRGRLMERLAQSVLTRTAIAPSSRSWSASCR